MYQIFQEIADSGVKVIIAGSTVGELALHYLNRMDIAVLKVLSKFELRRLCRVVNATPLARMGAPTPEEAGFVDVFETTEIGGDRVTVVRQLVEDDEDYDASEAAGVKTRTATVVLRGATINRLDDLERAIDDGVNVIKALLKDALIGPRRRVHRAGARQACRHVRQRVEGPFAARRTEMGVCFGGCPSNTRRKRSRWGGGQRGSESSVGQARGRRWCVVGC